jgi:capsular polysaccharide transport system permease protein
MPVHSASIWKRLQHRTYAWFGLPNRVFSAADRAMRPLRRAPKLGLILMLLPTALASAYYFGLAADQYESETHFVVRSAARPELSSGLGILTQLGLARSQDDAFIVQDFMTSRDAIRQLRTKLPLSAIFNREGADFLAAYPSILYGPEEEEFYRYFQRMVSVTHVDKTGISSLHVRAFTASDAHELATTLLQLGESVVNRINQRLQNDAVGNGLVELQAAQTRLVAAQGALTEFRNRELTIDPIRNAVALSELVAKLSSELGSTQAQIAEMVSDAGSSPQLSSLRRKAVALQEQIAQERARVTTGSDNLAERIATYERLNLEREFANRMLSSAEADLLRARSEVSRQMLYLERVVAPNLADSSTVPKRLRTILTVFAANVLLILVGWLIISGAREHGGASE